MPLLSELFTNAVEKLFFRNAVVAESRALAGHFREVELAGDNLKSVSWIPGQMVQFHLGNMSSRTYTPLSWDASAGLARFVFFLHGNGPGSEWAESLKVGNQCQLIGPRQSLDFSSLRSPVIFFGDETSIAAAQTPRCIQHNPENEYFFEVSSLIESQEVLRYLDFPNARLFQKLPGCSHLSQLASALADISMRMGVPQWIFTGKAQSIQVLKSHLRGRRLFYYQPKIRAFWAEGKAGLD